MSSRLGCVRASRRSCVTAGRAHAVRAPVGAFHAVYALAASFALCAALVALRIRDADAVETMRAEPSAARAPRTAGGG